MELPSVYESLDYRAWLKAWYEAKKARSPLYSLRLMAERMGVDGSYLHRVLNGQRHLSTPLVAGIAPTCGLSRDEEEYVSLLVSFNKARTESEARALHGKLAELRGVRRRLLTEAELRYWGSWRHAAVRSLVGIAGFRGGAAEVARRLRPRITLAQARESLALLQELGLVRRAPRGGWTLSDPHLTTGSVNVSAAVREFHRQMIDLARASLDEVPVEQRHVASLTLALDARAYADIVEMLRESRRQIQQRLQEVDAPDRVMQLSMQLFPLSDIAGVAA
jgi:uncharacterized protein (TIGR02147 family)